MAVTAFFVEQHFAYSGDVEMVDQVSLHPFPIDALQMTSGHDAGGERRRTRIFHFIDEAGLACQYHGQYRPGILFELAEGMQFGENLQSQQRSFVYDQDRSDLLSQVRIRNFLFYSSNHRRPGVSGRLHADLRKNRPVEVQDRTHPGRYVQDPVFRRVQFGRGVPERRRFSAGLFRPL